MDLLNRAKGDSGSVRYLNRGVCGVGGVMNVFITNVDGRERGWVVMGRDGVVKSRVVA